MANVLLGVTGSVAAIYTPELVADLQNAGFEVKVVATRPALYFFEPRRVRDLCGAGGLVVDDDEWPGRDEGRRYRRDDPVLHIELRRWADLLLIAPTDANTLAKLAYGLADNCLTCVARAWDPHKPLVLAPAMNTLMWQQPVTLRHFRLLAEDHSVAPAQVDDLPGLLARINAQARHLRVLPPVSKRLACDDVGIGAMEERGPIVEAVRGCLPSA